MLLLASIHLWSFIMSAFLCSDRHLATIAYNIAMNNGMDITFVQELANRLKKINICSVAFRYGKKPIVRKCCIAGNMETMDKHDIAGLISCWVYQACENPSCLEYLTMAAYLREYVKDTGGNPSHSTIWSI
jgi:hypothetical protein